MFDRLQEKLASALRNLRGLGKITESNVSEALAEVRSSLLEADVQYRVAQSFVDTVRQRALGEEVVGSVQPGQQFIKIINDELTRILGGATYELPRGKSGITKILMTGLQGSGKTTSVVKLARHLRDVRGMRPIVVSTDTQRPAAREQLEQFATAAGIQVFQKYGASAQETCTNALQAVERREVNADVLLIDTAGRLHIDETLMAELKTLKSEVKPDSTLYVLDSMAGQDAVRSAETFSRDIGFDGVIVTKMDGDARGGALLSVHMATGKPVAFIGVGEKADQLEILAPERIASRILGMGDIVSLVEKAQQVVDVKKAAEIAKKMATKQFTIADFAEQLEAVKKMGSIADLVDLLPGGAQLKKAIPAGVPEKEFKTFDAVIKSMTPRERGNYQIIDGSRRKRIAAGSGTSVQDVNRFLKQFLQARTMMAQMGKMGSRGFRPGKFF